jgi:hypothetical protein
MNLPKPVKSNEQIWKDSLEISLEGQYSDSVENYLIKRIKKYAEASCSIKDFYECQKIYKYSFYWKCNKEIDEYQYCLGG